MLRTSSWCSGHMEFWFSLRSRKKYIYIEKKGVDEASCPV
jgi:hypothetical protein